MAPWLLPWPGVFEFPPFDAARFDAAPHLAVIAGTWDFRLGWIDVDEASRRGITVVDTSRSMTPTVAEFGVGITLALLRDIPGAIDVVRRGEWFDGPKGQERYVFRDLADCRVGLAGYGSINRHYRRFVAPYGCEVASFDPLVPDEVFEADGVQQSRLARRARAGERHPGRRDPADAVDPRGDRRRHDRRARRRVAVRPAEPDGGRRSGSPVAQGTSRRAPSRGRRVRSRAPAQRRVVPARTQRACRRTTSPATSCSPTSGASPRRAPMRRACCGGEAPRYAATVRDKGLYVGRPSA